MKLTTLVRSAGALVLGLLLTAAPLWAQTALTTTTLGALVADSSSQTVTVASATGITAPGTGATFVYLLVDKELMAVRTVTGTNIGVSRGQNGTRSTPHVNASPVTVVPPPAIVNYVPSGQCVRANLLFVPVVVGGGNEQSWNGTTFDCLGATTAGQYAAVNTNWPQPVLGATMASTAGTLGAFTGTFLTISGTNAITGFTNPAGVGVGFCVSIVPSGVFTWTAAGNIALAGTAVVNKQLVFCWSGLKWIPNYIA